MTDTTTSAAGRPGPADLHARFEAEIRVAGIALSDEDRGPLFAMWLQLVPIRQRLRAADVALEEEPSFTQKPAQLGAGITLASAPQASTSAGGPA
jgi:hypothetical protein